MLRRRRGPSSTSRPRAIKEQGVEDYPISFGAIDWSWYLMALSMGDPMFDADLNPVFADEGSKAREAMAHAARRWFADELITPAIVGGEVTQHANFWGGTGTFHQGWQGSVAVGNGPEFATQAPNVAYVLLPDAHFTWSQPAALGIGTGARTVTPPTSSSSGTRPLRTRSAIYNAYGLYPSRPEVASAAQRRGQDRGLRRHRRAGQVRRRAAARGPLVGPVHASGLVPRSSRRRAPVATADAVIDQLADEWNSLKSEFS